MEYKKIPEVENNLDLKISKHSTSRFYFLLGFLSYFLFALVGCYSLWTHRYNDSAYKDVKVQPSSLYNPEYQAN